MLRALKAILRALANMPKLVMALVLVAGELVWRAVKACLQRPDATGDALEERAVEVAAAKKSDDVLDPEGDDPATEWGRGAVAILAPTEGPEAREVRFLDEAAREYVKGLTGTQRLELLRHPLKAIGQHLLGVQSLPTLPRATTMEEYNAKEIARLGKPLATYKQTLAENARLMAEAKAILEDDDVPEYRPRAA